MANSVSAMQTTDTAKLMLVQPSKPFRIVLISLISCGLDKRIRVASWSRPITIAARWSRPTQILVIVSSETSPPSVLLKCWYVC
jgi:hypothetical protein